MVGHKTTFILFLICIEIYLSIQAVIQPADILGDDSDPENQRHNKVDKRCRSQRRSMNMCQCCGTETFFVEYGTVCRRYCYKQYWPDGKGRSRGDGKMFGVAMNCTLQNDHNITQQDAEDNLFPLRPSLVPANKITCQIKRRDSTTVEVPLLEVYQFDPTIMNPPLQTTPTPAAPNCNCSSFEGFSCVKPNQCRVSTKKNSGFTTKQDIEQAFCQDQKQATCPNNGEICCKPRTKTRPTEDDLQNLQNSSVLFDVRVDLQTPELCPIITIRSSEKKKRSTRCKTTSDDIDSPPIGYDKPCIFPFTLIKDKENNISQTFNGCTKDGCGDNECKDYWCSTKVDENKIHVRGNWGYCNGECSRETRVGTGFQMLDHVDTGIVEDHDENKCKTTGGPRNAKPCVFPFIFQGKKYEACTEILQEENSNIIFGKAWCSTMVDGSRNYIPNEWGYCEYWNCPHEAMDKTCKTYSGPKNDNPCAFPFTFNGTEYNHCIITEDRCGEPWCATENTENAGDLESGSWGYCNHHCPDGQLS